MRNVECMFFFLWLGLMKCDRRYLYITNPIVLGVGTPPHVDKKTYIVNAGKPSICEHVSLKKTIAGLPADCHV